VKPRPLAALTLIVPLLAGCGDKTEKVARAPCPKGLLCLEYGNGAEISTLDPQKTSLDNETSLVGEFMLGLTDADAAGNTIPAMATRWETTADGLTWTFHLRDALWSDGRPVTADDFVYGYQREFDPKLASEQASQFYAIKNSQAINGGKLPLTALGVSAPDSKTFVIQLEHPWPILPDFIATAPQMSPIPRHVVEKLGDAWVDPKNFVGNGAYLPVSWKIGDRVVIRKNPRYFDADKVCIDQVSYYPTVDAISAERQVKNGQLDISSDIQSNRVGFLRRPGQMPDYVRVHPYVGVIFLAFNMRDVPALKDVRVRQALSMAIDRDFIGEKLFQGGVTPAYSTLPPGLIDYNRKVEPYWVKWPLERRQAEARRLLAQAGFGPNKKLRLELKHRNTADPSLYVPAVQADWRAIGVEVALSANESGVAYDSYRARDFQVADGGWVGGNDALGFLYLQRQQAGSQNYSGYYDARFEAVTKAADNERDFNKRMDRISEAEQMLVDAMPVAPIYNTSKKILVHPSITGWVDNSLNTHRVRYLCFKDAAERRSRG
jgi:oligopeptide transport system substrate-binding protein